VFSDVHVHGQERIYGARVHDQSPSRWVARV
jgi:hypothetical protein